MSEFVPDGYLRLKDAVHRIASMFAGQKDGHGDLANGIDPELRLGSASVNWLRQRLYAHEVTAYYFYPHDGGRRAIEHTEWGSDDRSAALFERGLDLIDDPVVLEFISYTILVSEQDVRKALAAENAGRTTDPTAHPTDAAPAAIDGDAASTADAGRHLSRPPWGKAAKLAKTKYQNRVAQTLDGSETTAEAARKTDVLLRDDGWEVDIGTIEKAIRPLRSSGR